MAVLRTNSHAHLSDFEMLCLAACKHMHGREMCGCFDRASRPCAAVQSIVQHIAHEVREMDRIAAKARRAEKREAKLQGAFNA